MNPNIIVEQPGKGVLWPITDQGVLAPLILPSGRVVSLEMLASNATFDATSVMFKGGAKAGGLIDCAVAIQAAVDFISAQGGGVLLFPAGTFLIGTAIVMKEGVTIRGAGMGLTIFKQAGNNRLFTRSFVSVITNLQYVAFQDFTAYGLWETTSSLGDDQDRHFAVDGVNHLIFHRVESKYCRQMAITAGYCEEVSVTDCRVAFCARDGINLTASSRCIVTGNHLRHISDDAVAIHQTFSRGNPSAEGHIVEGNTIEDSYGIKLLGACKAQISTNVLRRVKGYGVFLSDEGVEGNNDAYAVLISKNIITDIINATFYGGGSVAHGIFIQSSATSFQAPVVGAGTPDINKPETFSYLSNAATQNAGGYGIKISGNIIFGATMPAGNYTTWGFGQTFKSNGWGDLDLSSGFHFSQNGIFLGSTLLSVSIVDNHVEFVGYPVNAGGITYLGDALIASNTFRRYSAHGVGLETGSQKYGRVAIKGNTFDGDPYFESANRSAGPNGKWSNAAQAPTAVNAVNFKGVTLQGNEFRNVNQVLHSNAGTGISILHNHYFVQPDAACSLELQGNDNNRGIRVLSGCQIGEIVWEDSDPTSATYGQELSRNGPDSWANAMPTSGYYLKGTFVRNVVAIAAGTQILGWVRLTSGNAHVLSTDWRRIDITAT